MIQDYLKNLNPIIMALLATLFTWLVTVLGSALVFFFKTIERRILNAMLGFAAGVMIAASFWSLLNPAIEMAEENGIAPWIPAVTGFLAGGAFLFLIDKVLPHLHMGLPVENSEGIKTSWHRSILLVLAITIHNIPEGLAVGVAFGALASNYSSASLAGAIALAIGIGLQNFPEGAAVSIPLRREGFTRLKSFWYGQLSGIVEPIAGVAGAALVYFITPALPYALSFAAGAMIYVVVEELIPESQQEQSTDLSTVGAMLGFAVMMFLDVALG
jgi:ZIP family zinc transporter